MRKSAPCGTAAREMVLTSCGANPMTPRPQGAQTTPDAGPAHIRYDVGTSGFVLAWVTRR